jgi:hypothetical protein
MTGGLLEEVVEGLLGGFDAFIRGPNRRKDCGKSGVFGSGHQASPHACSGCAAFDRGRLPQPLVLLSAPKGAGDERLEE